MQSDRERILELLGRWSDVTDSGGDITPAELCADCPELFEDLAARIRFLRQLDSLVTPARDPDETELPGAVVASSAEAAPAGRAGSRGTSRSSPATTSWRDSAAAAWGRCTRRGTGAW